MVGKEKTLQAMFRTTTRCRVCGFAEIQTDAVEDRGFLLLSECPRCDHRWTEPVAFASRAEPVRVVRGPAREVASAA